MRSALSLFLLLLCCALLPTSASANTMDQFSVIGGGLDFEFALPASITLPDSLLIGQYIAPSVLGTVNGVPSTIGAHFIFAGACSACSTLFLTATPEPGGAAFPCSCEFGLPDLYDLSGGGSPDTATLTFLPGSYTSGYIIHAYFDVVPATITVTPETIATTLEPPSLTLVALALFASLCFASYRSRDPA